MHVGSERLQHEFAGHNLFVASDAWRLSEVDVNTIDALSAPHLPSFVTMDHSQGTGDMELPCASMQSLDDDVLRMVLMLVPQQDR